MPNPFPVFLGVACISAQESRFEYVCLKKDITRKHGGWNLLALLLLNKRRPAISPRRRVTTANLPMLALARYWACRPRHFNAGLSKTVVRTSVNPGWLILAFVSCKSRVYPLTMRYKSPVVWHALTNIVDHVLSATEPWSRLCPGPH